jgi:hypothetical protein
MHKRKAGSGHRIVQECDHGRGRQAMLAAEMQKSADEAVASASVIITASCPVLVGGKKTSALGQAIAQLLRFPL